MATTKKLTALGNYFTIPAMAEALGVSPHTLDAWVREHKIPVTKLGATSLLRLEDLSAFKARIGLVRKLLECEQ